LRNTWGQAVGVFGQVFQRHGAVFNEADRLAIALEAHHDVESGLSHLPQVLLWRVVDHFHHAAGQAEVTHEFDQLPDFRRDVGLGGPRELHQQNGVGLALVDLRRQGGAHRGRKGRVPQRQFDHRTVHQFHRAQGAIGAQFHDVLGRIHGLVEGREVHHAEHLGARQLAQAKRQGFRERQRAFAADQQVGEVDGAVVCVGPLVLVVEDVQVVAAHPAQHLGPAGVDVRAQGVGQGAYVLADFAAAACGLGVGSEVNQGAIRRPGLGAQHVVHHVAVGDRAAAAGVVAGHSAQRRLRAGGHVHRVPQAVGFQCRVQVVQNNAGFHFDGAIGNVHGQEVAHMLAAVDHQAGTHCLAALAGPAAPGHDGRAEVAADVQRQRHVGTVARHKDAHGHDLVDRGIGGVTPEVGGAEEHLTLGLGGQAQGEVASDFIAGAGGLFVDSGAGRLGDVAGQRSVHGNQAFTSAAAAAVAARNCSTTTSRL
jgi:hypothetical protein